MNILHSFFDKIVSQAATFLIGSAVTILVFLTKDLLPFLKSLQSSKLLALLALSIIALIVLFAYIASLKSRIKELQSRIDQQEKPLNPAYGFLWDDQQNPYCPNHKIPMTVVDPDHLFCVSCNKQHILRNSKGVHITFESVVRSLREGGEPEEAPKSEPHYPAGRQIHKGIDFRGF